MGRPKKVKKERPICRHPLPDRLEVPEVFFRSLASKLLPATVKLTPAAVKNYISNSPDLLQRLEWNDQCWNSAQENGLDDETYYELVHSRRQAEEKVTALLARHYTLVPPAPPLPPPRSRSPSPPRRDRWFATREGSAYEKFMKFVNKTAAILKEERKFCKSTRRMTSKVTEKKSELTQEVVVEAPRTRSKRDNGQRQAEVPGPVAKKLKVADKLEEKPTEFQNPQPERKTAKKEQDLIETEIMKPKQPHPSPSKTIVQKDTTCANLKVESKEKAVVPASEILESPAKSTRAERAARRAVVDEDKADEVLKEVKTKSPVKLPLAEKEKSAKEHNTTTEPAEPKNATRRGRPSRNTQQTLIVEENETSYEKKTASPVEPEETARRTTRSMRPEPEMKGDAEAVNSEGSVTSRQTRGRGRASKPARPGVSEVPELVTHVVTDLNLAARRARNIAPPKPEPEPAVLKPVTPQILTREACRKLFPYRKIGGLDHEKLAIAWRKTPKSGDGYLTYGDIQLTEDDFNTLEPDEKLNDNLLSAYLHLIQLRNNGRHDMPKVFAFSTFFYTQLEEGGYDRVSTWNRKERMFDYSILLIPIFLNKSHWSLVVVDFEEKKINYFDSLQQYRARGDRVLVQIVDYLTKRSKSENLTAKKLKKPLNRFDASEFDVFVIPDAPEQGNETDCGLFVCQNAEAAARRGPLTFDQKDMNAFRGLMGCELTKGILHP
ncbi:unnamed protein product, partial [Mesorhabditis spiculigera]